MANTPLVGPPFICKYCNYECKSTLGLKKHLAARHDKTPPHILKQLERFWKTVNIFREAHESKGKQVDRELSIEEKAEAVDKFLKAVAHYSEGKIDVDTHIPK